MAQRRNAWCRQENQTDHSPPPPPTPKKGGLQLLPKTRTCPDLCGRHLRSPCPALRQSCLWGAAPGKHMLLFNEHRLRGEKKHFNVTHTPKKRKLKLCSCFSLARFKTGQGFCFYWEALKKKNMYFIQTILETFLTFITINFSSN